ncbi:MAG: hypothetical protein KDH96_07435 [Candidatus Riesia sp.]|nr:hypothetical protein [Candidatus Riesia sp.]
MDSLQMRIYSKSNGKRSRNWLFSYQPNDLNTEAMMTPELIKLWLQGKVGFGIIAMSKAHPIAVKNEQTRRSREGVTFATPLNDICAWMLESKLIAMQKGESNSPIVEWTPNAPEKNFKNFGFKENLVQQEVDDNGNPVNKANRKS